MKFSLRIHISIVEDEIEETDFFSIEMIYKEENFYKETISKWLGKLFSEFDGEVSILFCSDKTIQELNSQYLDKDRPTDVLSFPQFSAPKEEMNEADMHLESLGDIVINVKRAWEQCDQFGNDFHREILRLLCHGLLHLLGYDHQGNEKEKKRMEDMEAVLLSDIY